MASRPPGRRGPGPLGALVALALALGRSPAAAGDAPSPGAAAFAAEVAEFAADLAVGDGAKAVTAAHVDFALRVVAPFGVRPEPSGLRVILLRAPRQALVSWAEAGSPPPVLPPEGEPPWSAEARNALSRAAGLYRHAESQLTAAEGPVRSADWLRTSRGHFGLRPFGVEEGPSIRARARASSLRWLRGAGTARADAASPARAVLLWRLAAERRPPGAAFLTGADMLAALAALTDPGPRAGEPPSRAARDGGLLSGLAELMERDLTLEPLDPYAADRLVEGLEWLAGGRLVLRSAPRSPLPPSAAPLLFTEVTEAAGLALGPPGDRVSVGGAWLDYDGDGRLDFYACVGSRGGRLLRGLPGLRFSDATEGSGLRGSLCRAAAADYDGDGDPDLVLSESLGPVVLMRNDGGRFVDASREAGLPEGGMPTQAFVWLDYDGDGRLDFYACVGSRGGRLLRGLPGLRFSDATEGSGLRGSLCRAAAADYDGDGDPDLVLSESLGPVVLMRNDGGRFVDASREAGLPEDGMPTQAFVWLDYDRDGLLDLYVVNHGGIVEGNAPYAGDAVNGAANRLFRQTAPGRFAAVPEAAGAADPRWGRGALAADLDGDGGDDLVVFNDFGLPQVYRSSGAAFVNDTARSGVGGVTHALGGSVADFDGDGRSDLLVSTFDRRWAASAALGDAAPRSLIDAEAFWMGEDANALLRSQLYRGRGDGTFEEVWERFAPAAYSGAAWNGTFVDLDNDGWQDIVMASGFHPDSLFFHADRKVVWLWDPASGRYADASAASGLDFPDSSRALLFADADQDGDLDALVLGYSGPRLFRNDAPPRRWVGVRLEGTRSAREARGAAVKVSCGGREQVFPYGAFGGGFVSSFAGSLHAGLGDCAGPVRLSVRWPSGVRQEAGLAPGRVSVVRERAP